MRNNFVEDIDVLTFIRLVENVEKRTYVLLRITRRFVVVVVLEDLKLIFSFDFFRCFFQTTCDDPENPIVQEEVVNDSDMVPIYDGKIIASMKLLTE